MKVTAQSLTIMTLPVVLLVAVVTPVMASINIDVSNNSSGSNRIQVNSSQKTTVNGSNVSNSNGKTTIKINNNGETKTIESNGEDVSYKSPDGTTNIEVKGDKASSEVRINKNDNTSVSAKMSDEEKKKAEEKKSEQKKRVEALKTKVEDKKFNFLDFLKERFTNLFTFTTHSN